MDFKFIDKEWDKVFQQIIKKYKKEYKFITPFVQLKTIEKFYKKKNLQLKLITRFNLNDFLNGVSNLYALEYILKKGGQIKGIKKLHSKLYIFDSSEAILSSANLTQSALLRNFEFGMQTSNRDAINSMETYFEDLWKKVPTLLSISQVKKWQNEIDEKLKKGKGAYKKSKLKDYGFAFKQQEDNSHRSEIKPNPDEKQYFVKFFGTGRGRDRNEKPVLLEVQSSGCHWACSYPKTKRPKNVNDGDIIFMGRLTSHPNDIMIFGYAIGHKYIEKRDDATKHDIEVRRWKEKWSRYIRVNDAQLIDGNLSDGISLNVLMKKFGAESFTPTLKNKIKGSGNTDPRKAYARQAAVHLTNQSAKWLMNEIENQIKTVGKISDARLAKLE